MQGTAMNETNNPARSEIARALKIYITQEMARELLLLGESRQGISRAA
jgi:hypothetical protein